MEPEKAMTDERFVAASVHGHAKRKGSSATPTYRSWVAMKSRCYDPNDPRRDNYADRGIVVCERWRTSFTNFLADMGERPAGTTLDRYPDNDGNYEPTNCRWATPKQQAANRRHQGRRKWRDLPVGVSRLRGKFYARTCVTVDVGVYKKLSLGTFATIDEAAHAYNKAANKLHGAAATLNPIGVDPRATSETKGPNR
jgi:hypothetical protein